MALQATHIKFALDLKNRYPVKNLEKYISGANYPDSRYLTGISRKLTHDLDSLPISNDDFQNGWHNHLVCDLVQGEAMDKLLPDEFNANKNEIVQGSDFWLRRTAIKIIQEIQIFESFDIQSYLLALNYVENPNNENIELVRKSNQIIQNVYHNKKSISIEDTLNIWCGLIMSEAIIDKIKKETERLLRNKEIVKIIKSIYEQMLILSKKYYS